MAVFGAALVASGFGLVVLAPAAFAHHPVVEGTVACATNGTQVITWTVANSETTAGTNRAMVVKSAATSSGTVSGLTGQSIKPQPPAPAPVPHATGTTTLPGTQSGSVTLTVHGDWSAQGGPADEVASGSVTLGGHCVPATTTTTTVKPTTTTTTVKPTTTTTTAKPTTTTVPATTTTTARVTTTTVPATTNTTAPATTTTTVRGTTTTTAPGTTTTTAPGTTTTTAPGTTTTTVAGSTTTTVAGATTTVPAVTTTAVPVQVLGQQVLRPEISPTVLTMTGPPDAADLPRTGSNVDLLPRLAVGIALMGAGLVIVAPRRRRRA